MSKKRRFFIACDEANHNCDKSQYNEATFWEKIKLTVHLIYCRACREYSNKNAKLTKIVDNPKIDCLNKDEKKKIKACFEKELLNQDQV
ncbi:MAG: hypothetical protein HKO92_04895 [Flavobacteriaceae bacterium]|nr:hypothetical protein [Bacteroidia bacterium]NNK82438.1 hypothetical protein [Flavobacteriaceae bacterium]